MATITKIYDVFISHAASDRDIVNEIATNLEVSGLATFHLGTIQSGSNFKDEIWQALAESRAVIAVVSPDALDSATMMVEIGAASAWNKPIFILINGPSSTKLPNALKGYQAYPLNRLDEVVSKIRKGFEPLTDDERDILASIYKQLNFPSDQLMQSPKALQDFTSAFNKKTKKNFSGERLMSELLRMRKQGALPRLKVKSV